MKAAIIGLPQSGKTTMFHALAGGGGGREKGGLAIGTVKVPDERVDRLAEFYHPERAIHAVIEVVEAHPARAADTRKSGMDAAFLNLVKPMDALLLVARAFDEEGLNEPAADARGVLEDLVLTDLLVVEQKLERLALDGKKGKPVTAEEVDALQRASALLNKGLRVATDKAVADLPALRSYALLSAKPALVVVNCAERDLSRPAADALAGYGLPVSGLPAFLCDAKIEEEIQELPPADRAEFLAAMGVVEPVLSVVVREMYRELGLISFLTVGEDECRAWTIRAGTPAVKAAGAVHSDIERGFIRAEVISYDDFRTFGSEAAARKAGRYRLEGKEYVMKDGDIVHFRFNA